MAILELKDIASGYGEVQILWGSSLSLEKGKLTCLVGGNGVGKTTAVANIAVALAAEGAKVVCLDGDIGLRNLDIVLSHATGLPTAVAREPLTCGALGAGQKGLGSIQEALLPPSFAEKGRLGQGGCRQNQAKQNNQATDQDQSPDCNTFQGNSNWF